MVGSAKMSVTFLALSLANVTFYIRVLWPLITQLKNHPCISG